MLEERWEEKLIDSLMRFTNDERDMIISALVAAPSSKLASRLVSRFQQQVSLKEALILFSERVILGDTIAWFPQAVRFGRINDYHLTVIMNPNMIQLFRDAYPDITFLTDSDPLPSVDYVVVDLCTWYGTQEEKVAIGSPYIAARILGIDHVHEPPRVWATPGGRPVEEPYVCIATQSTAKCKYWNNPTGWGEIVEWLKGAGYRVMCIDREPVFGVEGHWNYIPSGAEDCTGNVPLPERARWIKHADFFIGLSSGLSWLAWCCGVPVVLISGFSLPRDEFYTPYRVINTDVCHGCHSEFYEPVGRWDWCPHHQGTSREHECSRLITAEQVKDAIRKIPGLPYPLLREERECAVEVLA